MLAEDKSKIPINLKVQLLYWFHFITWHFYMLCPADMIRNCSSCYDVLIPTFSSLPLVLLYKSAVVKFLYTIRTLNFLWSSVYWYDSLVSEKSKSYDCRTDP